MKLTHPSSAQTVEVSEASLEMYLSQGWVRAPSPRRRPAVKPTRKASIDSAN